MGDYDWSRRTEFRSNTGERRPEIGNGNAYYANHPNQLALPRSRLPDQPPAPARTSSRSGSGSGWWLNDPEIKRRRRVAGYKAYSVEGTVKASLRKGIRWIKAKCSELVHGW